MKIKRNLTSCDTDELSASSSSPIPQDVASNRTANLDRTHLNVVGGRQLLLPNAVLNVAIDEEIVSIDESFGHLGGGLGASFQAVHAGVMEERHYPLTFRDAARVNLVLVFCNISLKDHLFSAYANIITRHGNHDYFLCISNIFMKENVIKNVSI